MGPYPGGKTPKTWRHRAQAINFATVVDL